MKNILPISKLLFSLMAAFVFLPPLFPAQTQVMTPFVHENYNYLFEINADGTATLTTEWIDRLNTAQGIAAYGTRPVYYNPNLEELELLEAAVIKPDGVQIPIPVAAMAPVTAQPFNGQLPPAGLMKAVTFPDLTPGCATRLKFKRTYKLPQYKKYFSRWLVFQANEIWQNIHITVNAPLDLELKFDAQLLKAEPAKETFGRRQYTWSGKFEEPVQAGINSVNFSDFSPYFAISSFADYPTLGKAYAAMLPKIIPPEVKKLADELTKDTSEPQKQAYLLYDWVRQNIGFVNFPFGSHNPSPFQGEDTLESKMGDAQKQMLLLKQLLAAKNIKSLPVLVSFSNIYNLPRAAILDAFNHTILYVPDLKTFLDTTPKVAPFGVLVPGLRGKKGLLAGEGSELIDIPANDFKENQLLTEITMEIQADSTISGKTVSVARGTQGLIFRQFFAGASSLNRQDFVRGSLSQMGETGSGSFEISDPNRTDLDFQVTGVFKLETFADLSRAGAMTTPTGFNPYSIIFFTLQNNLAERQTPFILASETFRETYRLTFPPNVKILTFPKDISFQNATGQYQSTYKQEGQTLMVTRELITNKDRYSAAEFKTLKELFNSVLRDLKAQILYQ
jgi:hypothetical protein